MSSSIKQTGASVGEVLTVDDEIARAEALINAGKVKYKYMLTVMVENPDPAGVHRVSLLTCGTPLPHAKAYLETASKMVGDMIGKQES